MEPRANSTLLKMGGSRAQPGSAFRAKDPHQRMFRPLKVTGNIPRTRLECT